MEFFDAFDGPDLDRTTWLPHYLPVWSSRAATAASYHLADPGLVLDLPPQHPLWCPEEHPTPLRVSGLMTGNFSGPVGSTVGQQPLFPGQRVREEQERFEGLLVPGGHLEVRCAMDLGERSMAALWLVGVEDEPHRCAEICVVEIFGRTVTDHGCRVGVGLHPFRDPEVTEDWDDPEIAVDPSHMHTYAVDWDEHEAVFTVDHVEVRRTPRPPAYPLQVMVGVFDFPDQPGDPDHVPAMRLEHVAVRPSA